jgi:hypothetical protein
MRTDGVELMAARQPSSAFRAIYWGIGLAASVSAALALLLDGRAGGRGLGTTGLFVWWLYWLGRLPTVVSFTQKDNPDRTILSVQRNPPLELLYVASVVGVALDGYRSHYLDRISLVSFCVAFGVWILLLRKSTIIVAVGGALLAAFFTLMAVGWGHMLRVVLDYIARQTA